MKSSSLRKRCKVGDEKSLIPSLGANAVFKNLFQDFIFHFSLSFVFSPSFMWHFVALKYSSQRPFSHLTCSVSTLAVETHGGRFSSHYAAQNVSYLFVRSMISVLLQVYLNFSFISSFLNVHFLAATLPLIFFMCAGKFLRGVNENCSIRIS